MLVLILSPLALTRREALSRIEAILAASAHLLAHAKERQ
jgi:hypothetical protein